MEVLTAAAGASPTGPALSPAIARRFDALACSLVVNLRGEDCDILARLLYDRGLVHAARRRTRNRWPRDRARAAELLGAVKSTAAFPDLVRLLGDRQASVRAAAAGALGRTGDPYAAAPLLKALEGPRALSIDVVSAAILEIGEPPANLLSHGLRSPSASTRALTAELLGSYQMVSATSELAQTLTSDGCPDVRQRAARALDRIGTRDATEALRQAQLLAT